MCVLPARNKKQLRPTIPVLPSHIALKHDEDVVKKCDVQHTLRSNATDPVPHKGSEQALPMGEESYEVPQQQTPEDSQIDMPYPAPPHIHNHNVPEKFEVPYASLPWEDKDWSNPCAAPMREHRLPIHGAVYTAKGTVTYITSAGASGLGGGTGHNIRLANEATRRRCLAP